MRLTDEDWWTPPRHADDEQEEQPRLYFEIPPASALVQHDTKMAQLKEEHACEEAPLREFMSKPGVIDHFVAVAERYVTRCKNFHFGEEEIEWSDTWFEQHGRSKRWMLENLGADPVEKLYALAGLVSSIMSGGVTADEKKSLGVLLRSFSATKPNDANASSVEEATTSTEKSTSKSSRTREIQEDTPTDVIVESAGDEESISEEGSSPVED